MQLNDITGLRVFLKSRLTAMYPTAAALSDRCSSDADPGALADYIIALLKHEKPTAELKLFCVNQLLDFLHESMPRARLHAHWCDRNGTLCGGSVPPD